MSVVPGADGIAIEISSSQAVTPRVSKLNSPSRIVVELPETVVASAQNKIPVGSAGVKGVRIGMDGKTPPTTSVVIDLEKPLAYELTPSAAGKADSDPAFAGSCTQRRESNACADSEVGRGQVIVREACGGEDGCGEAGTREGNCDFVDASKAGSGGFANSGGQGCACTRESRGGEGICRKPAVQAKKLDPKEQVKAAVSRQDRSCGRERFRMRLRPRPQPHPKQPKPEDKKWAMSGRRDPFFSPVVQQSGSGCSTGKKCLEIGAINLRGVVKSDNGFIAVVTNNLGKAYFLRENDPVFNGYVVKITGDSVVFQETIQDKLGKSFTREVVKRIFTPAV